MLLSLLFHVLLAEDLKYVAQYWRSFLEPTGCVNFSDSFTTVTLKTIFTPQTPVSTLYWIVFRPFLTSPSFIKARITCLVQVR